LYVKNIIMINFNLYKACLSGTVFTLSIFVGTTICSQKNSNEYTMNISDSKKNSAGYWPCWRGVNRAARPSITNIKKNWKGGLKKRWSVNNLCIGARTTTWSQPVVKGDRLVITGLEKDKHTVICLSANTGTLIWKQYYKSPEKTKKPTYGAGTRATPAIDGEYVYTFGCRGTLACWKLLNGKLIWMTRISELGGEQPVWGHTGSPLIYKDKLIVQGGGKMLVAAFNKMTGRLLWQSQEGKASYSSPMIYTLNGKKQIVVFTAMNLLGLDPETGRKIWSFTSPMKFEMNCTTPILAGKNQLLISATTVAKNAGGTTLIRITQNGAQKVWSRRTLGATHNDPVIVDGYIYAYSGDGNRRSEIRCLELATGNLMWKSEREKGAGNVLWVDNMLLCLTSKGKLMLAKATPKKFTVISSFDAIKGMYRYVWTPPVVANNCIYLRAAENLICYELKENNIRRQ